MNNLNCIRRHAVCCTAAAVFMVISTGCVPFRAEADRQARISLRITAWNVQTFFDAENDGCEYKEFCAPSSKWCRDAYEARLGRLCETIRTLNSDIYVFEEIENAGVMIDVANRLAGSSWRRSGALRYCCFVKIPDSAIGCAVLSKYPLSALTVHALDIRTEGEPEPDMRPLMEMTVTAENCALQLLVNHWKSKSGGREKTEKWRTWQEAVLADRITLLTKNSAAAVIACGDFNRDISDFMLPEAGYEPDTVLLRRAPETGGGLIAVHSPWFVCAESGIGGRELVEPGSYFFREQWERIDHLFAAGCAEITAFKPETDGPWTTGSGIPAAYQVYAGSGYSDHLPVSCTVTVSQPSSEKAAAPHCLLFRKDRADFLPEPSAFYCPLRST